MLCVGVEGETVGSGAVHLRTPLITIQIPRPNGDLRNVELPGHPVDVYFECTPLPQGSSDFYTTLKYQKYEFIGCLDGSVG